jgi:hypothetical protein
VRNASGDLDVWATLQLGSEWAIADEHEAPFVERRERIGEPNDVLALDEAPDEDEHRSVLALSGV